MSVMVLIGAQWGDEGKGKATDLYGERVAVGGALPGRQQRRPHRGAARRAEVRAAPDPVRHPHAGRHQRDRQRGRHRPGRAADRAGRPGRARRRHQPAADLRRRAPDHAVPRGHRQGLRALPGQGQDRHHRSRHRPGLRGQGRPARACGCRTCSTRRSWRRRSRPRWTSRTRCWSRSTTARRWTPTRIVDEVLEQAEGFKHRIADTRLELGQAVERGENILLEGSQGTLLDVDHGTYPYVTSSNPTAGGAAVGAGIGPTRDHLGARASSRRTPPGSAPARSRPSCIDEWGEYLRKTGGEVGVTTGPAAAVRLVRRGDRPVRHPGQRHHRLSS